MKKLLVIANPYPPMASAGTTRVVRFLRHLPDEGWEPSVLTAHARPGPAAVPPDVRVARAAVPWPRQLLGGGRRSTKVNRWVAVPDPYFAWVAPAVLKGREIVKREQFDVILSSSPRASAHLVAAVLSEHAHVPWLADYRDPWSTYQFRQYPTRGAQGGAREARGVGAGPGRRRDGGQPADRRRPRRPAPVAGRPRPRAPQRLRPHRAARPTSRSATASGSSTPAASTAASSRSPRFLEALATLPADVKALFVGVDESRVRPDADRFGLGDRVRVEPFVPLPVALGYQRAADALLLVNGRRPESMSSKVFEYLQAGRPIFAISPAGSAARGLFEETGGGTCVLPDEPMAAPLADFVAAVREGRAPVADPAALGRYELGHLTAELAAILDDLAAHPWVADPEDRDPSPASGPLPRTGACYLRRYQGTACSESFPVSSPGTLVGCRHDRRLPD